MSDHKTDADFLKDFFQKHQITQYVYPGKRKPPVGVTLYTGVFAGGHKALFLNRDALWMAVAVMDDLPEFEGIAADQLYDQLADYDRRSVRG